MKTVGPLFRKINFNIFANNNGPSRPLVVCNTQSVIFLSYQCVSLNTVLMSRIKTKKTLEIYRALLLIHSIFNHKKIISNGKNTYDHPELGVRKTSVKTPG